MVAVDTAKAKTCLDLLQGAGLSVEAAIGVLGNYIAESGLSTTVLGDGGKALGLCQWHPDRQKTLLAWCASNRLAPDTLRAQVLFSVWEAKTPAGGKCWDDLTRCHDIDLAAAIWMRKFERPADQSDAAAKRRADAGRRAYAALPKPPPAPKPKPPTASRVHVVKAGDTLHRIAEKRGTTLAQLRRLNPGLFDRRHQGGDLIHPGETVRLP